MAHDELMALEPGMTVIFGGNKIAKVTPELAAAFKAGDHLIVVHKTGDILHVPAEIHKLVSEAVGRALEAFEALHSATDDQFTQFFNVFANMLANNSIWDKIKEANDKDVMRAKSRGRSTTRLVADEKMRRNMISGLHEWRDMTSKRDTVIDVIEHNGWQVESISCPCGVVAFVFEGRPNVLADATGVIRGGNTAVFRIGSDALGTAKAIMKLALLPALETAGLPSGSVVLLDSTEHSAGWALFADDRLALAVARGTGKAVDLLGAIARQAGNTVSLHGTGGGWIIGDSKADPYSFGAAIYHSCDRKVCNTVNTICITEEAADVLIESMLHALQRRGDNLGYGYRLHVAEGSEGFIPKVLFNKESSVMRADGISSEPVADVIAINELGREWEWEQTPEVSVVVVKSLEEGIDLFNKYSPLLVASLISEDQNAHRLFMKRINAPFIGNGFTRWVDGQYALRRPELGLSNWQGGRPLGRSALLTGDGVFSIRLRAWQVDPDVHR